MSTEEPFSFDVDELGDLVEGGLAPYRRLLPASAVRHFRGAALFLLEVHPAARQWQRVLRSTWMARRAAAPSPPADTPVSVGDTPTPPGPVAEGGMIFGFMAESTAEREHYAELLAHEGEAGLAFLVEAPFPPAETPAEAERALRQLVDLALVALFSGALGAFARHTDPNDPERDNAEIAMGFLSTVVLVARIAPNDKDRDAAIWNAYFGNKHRVEEDAKRHGRSVAEEQQDILGFLERFSRAIKDDIPRMERALQAALAKEPNPTGPSRSSVAVPVTARGRARRDARRKQRS